MLPEPVRNSTGDYRVSASNSRHSAIKQMRYSVGVGSIVKVASDPPKVGRAIDNVAAAP